MGMAQGYMHIYSVSQRNEDGDGGGREDEEMEGYLALGALLVLNFRPEKLMVRRLKYYGCRDTDDNTRIGSRHTCTKEGWWWLDQILNALPSCN